MCNSKGQVLPLAALGGVEDPEGRALQERQYNGFQTEGGVQRVADLPRDHVTAVPIRHRWSGTGSP